MKKVAIVQSNYIPWKGYFDLIASVDEFIFYDTVQFTKNDWRNRNRIKTPKGVEWIAIPVGPSIHRRVCDVELPAGKWRESHWRTLELNYRKAPHFDEIADVFAPFYIGESFNKLSRFSRALIEVACRQLGIDTRISDALDYKLIDGRTERLVDLCLQVGGTEYVSGPAAQAYLEPEKFAERDVKLTWIDYSGYPEYPQLWGSFVHQVTILDLLFNCGRDAPHYMKHVIP